MLMTQSKMKYIQSLFEYIDILCNFAGHRFVSLYPMNLELVNPFTFVE